MEDESGRIFQALAILPTLALMASRAGLAPGLAHGLAPGLAPGLADRFCNGLANWLATGLALKFTSKKDLK